MINDGHLAALSASAYTATPTWVADDVHALYSCGVLAFRGTVPTSISDWLRDFDALPVDDSSIGWCHQGFRDGTFLVLPAILRGLDATTPIVLTGHSLGGALAVVTAALLVSIKRPVAKVVTFGAPRAVGSRAIGLLRNTPTRQYCYGNDPVPLLPPIFDHIAPLTAIGRPGDDPITDHDISNYITALLPDKAAA